MKRILILVTVLLIVYSQTVISNAASMGSQDYPGYSAKDIKNHGGTNDGVYWIDPDLPGGDAPFQVFANMVYFGGGWTLSNDNSHILPDMSAHPNAINILSVEQNADILFVGAGLFAYYTGRYYQNIPGQGSWTVVSGNPQTLYGRPWSSIDLNTYDIYVREKVTQSYPAPTVVPEPISSILFVTGGTLLAGRRLLKCGSKRKHNNLMDSERVPEVTILLLINIFLQIGF